MIKFIITADFEKPSNWNEISRYLYINEKSVTFGIDVEPTDTIIKKYTQYVSLWLTSGKNPNFITDWKVVDFLPTFNPKTGSAVMTLPKKEVYAYLKNRKNEK